MLWIKLAGTLLHGDVKMNKFEVGQRVVLVSDSNLKEWNVYVDDTTRGVIETINSVNNYSIKWDSKWHTPNPSNHNASELITETEANEIRSQLEKEYEIWAGPIRNKMEQAAKCLEEAEELASKQNKNLAEMHELTYPIVKSMDQIGWITSSLSC
jgi:hypothetical protein